MFLVTLFTKVLMIFVKQQSSIEQKTIFHSDNFFL